MEDPADRKLRIATSADGDDAVDDVFGLFDGYLADHGAGQAKADYVRAAFAQFHTAFLNGEQPALDIESVLTADGTEYEQLDKADA